MQMQMHMSAPTSMPKEKRQKRCEIVVSPDQDATDPLQAADMSLFCECAVSHCHLHKDQPNEKKMKRKEKSPKRKKFRKGKKSKTAADKKLPEQRFS